MYLVYQFDVNDDPVMLSKTLWRLKISHKITMNKNQNELWLSDPSHQATTLQLIQTWKDDPQALLRVNLNRNQEPNHSRGLMSQFRSAPATVIIILAALIVAAITQLDSDVMKIRYFTISPLEVIGNQVRFYPLSELMTKGEYWRFFSPALLHFSVMHIVFNVLWVWDVGRRLERIVGSSLWLLGVSLIAIVSNVLQFEITGNPLFGGLSGVVYGLIGFAWLMPILNRQWPTIIRKPLMIFFMVWLVVGYTPLTEMIGLGSIANTAHTIGLASGLVLSLVYWFVAKIRSYKNV
ncbi:rhomboid family intramembrane serine protease [Marinomonas colpomeniae]|uniref:Rhomboid family intramembrane serine protease n=1 Tax=Marinomonas colpomeniae TaxID=2774408 RepID=A0ABR8P3W1_9GAMM|nr:rhomboid family intramembrane serine protease [Marinomonas colpomeniae]MBD5772113.1 rhomboid family intramembrane serine protease [Marinomonas colpomeniae]